MEPLKQAWNKSEGITVDYVDPANLVWSYTEDPNFEDIYYVGEVKNISLPELKKQFPELSSNEAVSSNTESIQVILITLRNTTGSGNDNNNTVQVLYFEYKTYVDQVYKIKYTDNRFRKSIRKT